MLSRGSASPANLPAKQSGTRVLASEALAMCATRLKFTLKRSPALAQNGYFDGFCFTLEHGECSRRIL